MDTNNKPYLTLCDKRWIDVCIKATPRSKRELIGSVVESSQGQRLEIKVHAEPSDGKANQAIIKLIAKKLKIPSSQCVIQHGHSSRYKTLRLPYNENMYKTLIELWPVHYPQQASLFSIQEG